MDLPTRLTIAIAIATVHQEPWFSDKTAEEINQGYCEDFADNVEQELGHPEVHAQCMDEIPEYFGHFWIRALTDEGEFFFDAETPLGVEHPSMLPIYQRRNARARDSP